MKNIHYILILILMLYSCGQPAKENPKPLSAITTDTPNSKAESKPYSNPALIYGSSFGTYFQSQYRLNHFTEMLDFTSKESRIKFGDKVLLGFYRNEFKLDFKLGKLTAIEKSGDTNNLIYGKASILSRRKIVIPILIENDSCKIIIHSLKNPFN